MSSARFQQSLFSKAVLLVIVLMSVGCAAIVTALLFKHDLNDRFQEIITFDQAEEHYLLALWTSIDTAEQFSLRGNGPVFISGHTWAKRLQRAIDMQHQLPANSNSAADIGSLEDAMKQLQSMLGKNPSADELKVFAADVVRIVNSYSQSLHLDLSRLRSNQNQLIREYSDKSDLYSWVLMAITGTGFLVTIVPAVIFLTKLVRSVQELQRTADDIARGNYDSQLKSERDDEIGLLVDSVNRMARSLRAHEKETNEFRQRLTQQEKVFTLGSFAAGIAHEVGNPVQAILALSSHVRDCLEEHENPESVQEIISYVDTLLEQVERLDTVVSEVRDLTYSGMPEMELVSLNQVVERTLRLLRFDRRFKMLSLATELDNNLPMVRAVSDHLVQVILNILINAADAVDQKTGHITAISTFDPEQGVSVTIKDDGHGMPAEIINKVTDPFFTTKERGKGTGLGLAICRTIVQEHGGELIIKSKPGQGSEISIILPQAEENVELQEGDVE